MAGILSRRKFIGHAQHAVLATSVLSLVGCDDDGTGDLLSFGGPTMGTTYSIKLVDIADVVDADALARDVDGILETINRQMSTYLPDSELSRFNAADAGLWTSVSADTLAVIERSRLVHRMTGGSFDPTVGPIVNLWGFGPDRGEDRVPPSGKIADAAETVGFSRVESRTGSPAVRKRTPGVQLDLSGVAKGFAVDKVADHLEASGVTNYLVEVGGELRAGGHGPAGRPWRVGIEKPSLAPDGVQQVVDLEGAAMATSGNYRIFFEEGGRRYSHIVDPRTGRPVEHDLASVTVIAATTLEADALSTSLLVLGQEDGMALAGEQDIAAFFVTERAGSFEEAASPAFTPRRPA